MVQIVLAFTIYFIFSNGGFIGRDAGVQILLMFFYLIFSWFILAAFVLGIINIIKRRYIISNILILVYHVIVMASVFITIDNFSGAISTNYPIVFWSAMGLFFILLVGAYRFELRKKNLVEAVS